MCVRWMYNLNMEEKSVRIGFRENEETKKHATIILNSLGLDISTACRMFLRQVIQTKSIPFRMESGLTAQGEKEILDADQEISEKLSSGKISAYSSAQELFDDIG